MPSSLTITIRDAESNEFAAIGELMVNVYSALPEFPSIEEQPQYFALLKNIGEQTTKPHTRLLVAILNTKVVGAVVYFSDMSQYGSGGTATQEKNASGFRLLCVSPTVQGQGIGHALIEKCISLAQMHQHQQVIIHTTSAMQLAWQMYQKRGFQPAPELDFMQGNLPVFGLRLIL